MKTLRLLAALLLVALSTGFISCEKDLEAVPIDDLTSDAVLDNTDKEFAEYMDDYSDIKCRYAQGEEGSMLLSGIKKKHLWFSEFDTTTKKLKSTWLDIEETDTIQQVHKGYGEYEQIIIKKTGSVYYKKTSTGDIVQFGYTSTDTGTGGYQTIFTSNGKTKRTTIQDSYHGNYLPYDWYKESIFIQDCCFSHEGDTIYMAKGKSYSNTELLSYEEGIEFTESSVSFRRRNYKYDSSIWFIMLKNYDVPTDAKVDYSLLDKSSNIWKYKLHIKHYNGTSNDYIYFVNINDGEFLDRENTTNKADDLVGIWQMLKVYDNGYAKYNITLYPNGVGTKQEMLTMSNNHIAMVIPITYKDDKKNNILTIYADNDKAEYSYKISSDKKELMLSRYSNDIYIRQ